MNTVSWAPSFPTSDQAMQSRLFAFRSVFQSFKQNNKQNYPSAIRLYSFNPPSSSVNAVLRGILISSEVCSVDTQGVNARWNPLKSDA